jgi:hypothetical protein
MDGAYLGGPKDKTPAPHDSTFQLHGFRTGLVPAASRNTMDPTEKLRPGMSGSQQTVVTREITVAHFHPEMPEVYGTPFLIYLIEVASSNAIKEHLPKGWVSVGYDTWPRLPLAEPSPRRPAWILSTADSSSSRSKRTTEWLRSGTGTHVRGWLRPQ